MSNLEDEIVEKENALYEDRQILKEKERKIITLKTDLREKTIKEQFVLFLKGQDQSVQDSVYLNNVLLHAAVVSYYYDIHRYKNFAGSRWANCYKQAAYTIKWIVKFRPIQIKEKTENVSEKLFDINLIFSLVCGFSFLDTKMVDLIMNEKKRIDNNRDGNNTEKESSFYDKLLYVIRYRHLSGKQLMFIFETLRLYC